VIRWAIELSEIVDYLHSLSPPVLHRDLTPDNLIVGVDQHVQLLDFGAANQFLEGVTGTLVGKQAYVPPEQLRGTANQQSDIYSFGATLFFLLTGQQPRALAQSDVIAAGVKISEQLNQLIKDCTEFEDSKRPESFAIVLSRLKLMNGSGGADIPPTSNRKLGDADILPASQITPEPSEPASSPLTIQAESPDTLDNNEQESITIDIKEPEMVER